MFGLVSDRTKSYREEKPQLPVLPSHKLLTKNKKYNLIQLKSHLIDEGVIELV